MFPVPPSSYVPGAHGLQEAAPEAAVKFPAPQALQPPLPVAEEKVPGAQEAQEAGG